MAQLTRKYLTALGIDADKIDSIIESHTDTLEAIKAERDKLKGDVEKVEALTKERDALSAKVQALEKAGGDAAKVQQEFDAYKASVETEKTNAQKTALIKAALEAEKANPAAIALLMKEIDLSKVELDGDKLKDAKAVVEPVKAAYGAFFGKVNQQGTPIVSPPSSGNNDQNDLSDEDYYAQYYQKQKG